ncbi:MAG: hypothetical protein H7Y42_16280 [Chitinophagaceae bacterium]|nr:hypothetical protein [Chitinophagaceae bacterium]
MDTWYSKELGDGMMAATPSAEIEDVFLRLFDAAGKPLSMAVFTRPESEGRLHCEIIAYFSPAAKDVAKAFDAQPCGKPARAGLGLLAGDELSWSALFPERD